MKGLVEVLAEVGNDNLQYQNVKDSLVSCKLKGGRSEITLVTDALTPNQVVDGTGKEGLIIWVDRDVLTAALKKVQDDNT